MLSWFFKLHLWGKIMKYEPVIQSEMIVTNSIQIDDPKIKTSFVPVGFIGYYASSIVPNGYLVCNGAEVSKETYQELYSLIGNTYGTGSTEDKFKLPDLINQFVQGNSNVGTKKSPGLPDIFGKINITFGNTGVFAINGTGPFIKQSLYKEYDKVPNVTIPSYKETPATRGLEFNASLSNSIYGNSTTVQPPSLTLLPCIKY